MRKITFITFMALASFSLYGCTKAKVEKMPVELSDEAETMSDLLSDEDDSKQKVDNSENQSTESQDPKSKEDKANTEQKDIPLSEDGGETDPEPSTETDAESKNTTENSADNENQPTKMIVEVEGMQEEINGLVFESELGYTMAYDIDRFEVTSNDGIDVFLNKNPNPELIPYTYLKVGRIDKSSNENIEGFGGITFETPIPVSELESKLQANEEDVTIGNETAKHSRGYIDSDLGTKIVNIYLMDRGDYYYYIVTSFFVDGEEGWGARMKAMINTFTFE